MDEPRINNDAQVFCLGCGKIAFILVGGLCEACIKKSVEKQEEFIKELLKKIEKLKKVEV